MNQALPPLVLGLLGALLAAPAHAGGIVAMSSITVNGLEVHDLQCTLDHQGGFAVLDLVGALSNAKGSLDLCAPAGAAVKTTWTWGGAAPTAHVDEGLTGDAAKCVEKAVAAVQNGPVGTCTGTLLIGAAPPIPPSTPAPAAP